MSKAAATASHRPWNSRPDGPNEGQKFANELARKMGRGGGLNFSMAYKYQI